MRRARRIAGSFSAAIATGAFAAAGAWAGPADVLSAKAECDATSTCRFFVSIRHDDEGWDHFANLFEVLDAKGNVLGTRRLRHPHVDEQPFTRVLFGVAVPEGVDRVTVRATDSQHGLGGAEVEVKIERGE